MGARALPRHTLLRLLRLLARHTLLPLLRLLAQHTLLPLLRLLRLLPRHTLLRLLRQQGVAQQATHVIFNLGAAATGCGAAGDPRYKRPACNGTPRCCPEQ